MSLSVLPMFLKFLSIVKYFLTMFFTAFCCFIVNNTIYVKKTQDTKKEKIFCSDLVKVKFFKIVTILLDVIPENKFLSDIAFSYLWF